MADQEYRPSSPRDRLLDELESIKDVLDGEADPEFDIPVLSDIVTDDDDGESAAPMAAPPMAPIAAAPARPAGLLDLDRIFDDADFELDDGLGDEDPIPTEDDLDLDIAIPEPAPAFQFPRFTLDVDIADDTPGVQASIAPPSTPAMPVVPAPSPAATIAPAPAPIAAAAPIAPPSAATSAALEPTPAAPLLQTTAKVAPKPRLRPDYSREVLIQELVDEFIPQIEAELRARLNAMDFDDLRAWKERK